MITPNGNSSFTTPYDPLTSQFLTGGQMGYMPQAQFMTSPEYGAFRTMPQTAPYSPVTHRQSVMQSYLIQQRGFNYFLNVYNPSVNQLQYQIMASRRVQDSFAAMGATGVDFAASMGASAAIGGMLGGPLGLAAGFLMPSVAAPYLDRIRQSRSIQQATMPKIFSGADMSQGLHQGFSMTAASQLDQGIRDMAAGDSVFKQADYREIMRIGIRGGLFDYSNSASQYKDTLKKLRGNFKVMMELFESADFNEIGQNLQRLQRMGANVGQMQSIAGMEHMFTRMTGISHNNLVSTYGQQGAMIYSQAGLTGYQGSLENMANASRIEMMKRLGLVSASEVARAGGVSGMAQRMTQDTAVVTSRLMDSYLPYLANGDFSGIDRGKMASLLSGSTSIDDAMRIGAGRINSAGSLASYQSHKAELQKMLIDSGGPQAQALLTFQSANRIMGMMGMSFSKDNLTAAYMAMGYSPETARDNARLMTSPDSLASMQKQLLFEQHTMRMNRYEERSSRRGLGMRIALSAREAYQSVKDDLFGTLISRRARDNDYEESVDSGISYVDTFGVNLTGLGKNDYAANFSNMVSGPSRGSKAYYRAMSSALGFFGASAAELEFSDRLSGAQGSKLTIDQFASTLSKYNLSPTTVKQMVIKYAKGSGATTMNELKSALADGIKTEAAKRGVTLGYVESHGRARELLSGELGTATLAFYGKQDAEAVSRARDTIAEGTFKFRALSKEQLRDKFDELSGNLGDLTSQAFGFIDSGSQLSTLKKAMSKDSSAALVWTSATVLGQLDTMSGSDREHFSYRVKKLLKSAGISDSAINNILNRSVGSERLDALKAAIGDRFGNLDVVGGGAAAFSGTETTDSLIGKMDIAMSAKGMAVNLTGNAKMMNLYTRLGNYTTGSVENLVRDKTKLRALLSSGKLSNKDTAIVKRLLAINGPASDSDILGAAGDLLDTADYSYKFEATTEGDDPATKALGASADAITSILIKLNESIQNNTAVVKEFNTMRTAGI